MTVRTKSKLDFCIICGKYDYAHKKDYDHVYHSILKRDDRELSLAFQEMFN